MTEQVARFIAEEDHSYHSIHVVDNVVYQEYRMRKDSNNTLL